MFKCNSFVLQIKTGIILHNQIITLSKLFAWQREVQCCATINIILWHLLKCFVRSEMLAFDFHYHIPLSFVVFIVSGKFPFAYIMHRCKTDSGYFQQGIRNDCINIQVGCSRCGKTTINKIPTPRKCTIIFVLYALIYIYLDGKTVC